MTPREHAPGEQELDLDLLELYLNDHLAGATAGRSRARRMVQAHADLPIHEDLRELAGELDEEFDRLARLIRELGLTRKWYRQLPAKIGEELGRLKLNNRLLGRSPMTPLLEVELLRGAVNAKAGLWELLCALSPHLGLEQDEWRALVDRARQQDARLATMHARLGTAPFER